MTNPFNPYLDKYIKANVLDFSEIPADRKEDLERLLLL